MSTVIGEQPEADSLQRQLASLNAAVSLTGLQQTLAPSGGFGPVFGLVAGSTAAGTANSAIINALLTAGDALGGRQIIINTPGTVYLADTLVWSSSHLIVNAGTTLKMGPSTWPVPMFRNRAYVNRLSTFKVITSMTYSQATGLVTVACASHGLSLLQEACIWGANQNGYNGIYPVFSVVNANSFTYMPDEPPTVLAATASTFLLDSSGSPNMRMLLPDIGGRLDCYGTADMDCLYLADNGDPGNPTGLNGPNAATPPSGNSTDYDTVSLLFTKNWTINFYGTNKHSREHAMWVCHSKGLTVNTFNIESAGADGVHFTGPIQDVTIGTVQGHSIDNFYAIGTSDYTAFNLSEGQVRGIKARLVQGNDCLLDVVRLIGESQYPIDGSIDEIAGSVQSSGMLFNSFFDSLMVQGGNLWVRNFRIGAITGHSQNVAVCSSSAFRTDYLEIGPFTLGVQNQVGLLIGGPASSTAKHIVVNAPKSLDDQVNANYGNIVFINSATFTGDTLEVNDLQHKRSTNAGTAGSGIAIETSAGNFKHIVINNPNFYAGVALFRLQNTIETKVDINNILALTPSQIGIVGSSSNVRSTVALNGGLISMTTGTLFAMQAATTTELEIRGGGCMVPGTFDNSVGVVSRTGSQVCRIYNWDLFSDPVGNGAIATTGGQYMNSNRGGVNDARYGPCVYCAGTNPGWYALGRGASGVNLLIT